MEACLAVEDLLQQMRDQGWLEVSDEGVKSSTYACSPQMKKVLESLNLWWYISPEMQLPKHPNTPR